MALSRTHKVVINLTFDKPITKEQALASAKDCIHGEFYPDVDGEELIFKIRSITKYMERKAK